MPGTVEQRVGHAGSCPRTGMMPTKSRQHIACWQSMSLPTHHQVWLIYWQVGWIIYSLVLVLFFTLLLVHLQKDIYQDSSSKSTAQIRIQIYSQSINYVLSYCKLWHTSVVHLNKINYIDLWECGYFHFCLLGQWEYNSGKRSSDMLPWLSKCARTLWRISESFVDRNWFQLGLKKYSSLITGNTEFRYSVWRSLVWAEPVCSESNLPEVSETAVKRVKLLVCSCACQKVTLKASEYTKESRGS